MGDRGGGGGGRFQGRRGGQSGRNPQAGRNSNIGGRPHVWHRDSGDGGGRNYEEDERSRERWEKAGHKQGMGSHDLSEPSGSALRSGQSAGVKIAPSRAPSPAKAEPCFNCNISGHFAASCPTIRCDRCKKLGHIRETCTAILPWECMASMCGFQSPGKGFFYFPDRGDVKQMKEKVSTVVITALEGEPTFRDIETEFNEYFGGAWRCTARNMGPKQFLMRFPSSKEVDRTSYFGKRMEMKTFDGVLSIKPWSAGAGAKAEMQKGWVKIRNIPIDRRCEATAAYVGSLVGVSLEIDLSTLHKPEYCRVLIGCRNIWDLPEVAEGVLGDFFYDFYYELETVVVGEPPKQKVGIAVNNNSAPSPKRSRVENSSSLEPSNNETAFTSESSQNHRGYVGARNYSHNLGTLSEHDSEEESEEDQGLLIEQLAREGQYGDKMMEESDKNVPTDNSATEKEEENVVIRKERDESPDVQEVPVVIQKDMEPPIDKSGWILTVPGGSNEQKKVRLEQVTTCVKSPWAPVTPTVIQETSPVMLNKKRLSDNEWPPLIDISEVEREGSLSPADTSKYSVQTPDNSPVGEGVEKELMGGEKLSSRNQIGKMGHVVDQATNATKKRNLEGLYDAEEAEAIRNGAMQLASKAMEISKRVDLLRTDASDQRAPSPCDAQGLMLTGD